MQATDVDRSIDGFLALAKKLRTSAPLRQGCLKFCSCCSCRSCVMVEPMPCRKTDQVDDLVADEAEPADVEFTFGWDCSGPKGLVVRHHVSWNRTNGDNSFAQALPFLPSRPPAEAPLRLHTRMPSQHFAFLL